MNRMLTIVAVALFLLCGSHQAAAGPVTYSFDTSSLVGLGDFGFDALLIDGDGANNTSITLDLYDFGRGAPSGSPTLVGGGTGDLSGVAGLTDVDFFNSFTQLFTPGA